MPPDDTTRMPARAGDQTTIRAATEVLRGDTKKGLLARILPFLGPAFIACVAYVDPGNFATNIQGGSEFGYMLLWVVVASNLMAMLVQALSAKLGIATGRNLAEHVRDRTSRPVGIALWLVMELVAMATDLAEFLGAAIGFQLLFHIPLLAGGILTGIATFLILGLERRGFRPLEAVITALVGVIAASYVIVLFLAPREWSQVAYHAVVPQFRGTESILLAAGILGATVMPHVIFLHSALMQDRIVTRDPEQLRRLFRFEVTDVVIAMGVAGFVNAAMLIMAAATFHQHGLSQVGTIEQAHKTLVPLLGGASGVVFAVSLLASGLSSSAVGTMSGQVMMQGFVHWQIPVWLRRSLTMLPSLVVIALGLDPTRVLVLSQVVLSFAIPFALVPLVLLTRRRDVMGVLVNKPLTTVLAGLVTALIIVLNVFLLYQQVVQTLHGG